MRLLAIFSSASLLLSCVRDLLRLVSARLLGSDTPSVPQIVEVDDFGAPSPEDGLC